MFRLMRRSSTSRSKSKVQSLSFNFQFGYAAGLLACQLIGVFVEEYVDYVESYRSATDNNAGSHGSPENVSSGELPNGEERSNNRYQDAGAGRPERDRAYGVRIEIASPRRSPDFLHIVIHCDHSATHARFSEFDHRRPDGRAVHQPKIFS
jgi:hypothetical protein